MNQFFSPLIYFHLSPNDFQEIKPIKITDEISILPQVLIPNLNCLSSIIHPNRIQQYQNVYHWLNIKTTKKFREIEELVNLFQLVLWIIKRTSTNIHFISNLSKSQSKLKFNLLHSRFTFIPKNLSYELTKHDIMQLQIILKIIVKLYYDKTRLRNAIVLNYNACIAPYWEASYLLFSTTFESLLTYGEHKNLTETLAKSYAALSTVDIRKREKYYEDFRKIFRIRSDIVHGSAANKSKYKDGDQNLKYLANVSDILRCFWVRILNDTVAINNLIATDNFRRKYLEKIIGSWKSKKYF